MAVTGVRVGRRAGDVRQFAHRRVSTRRRDFAQPFDGLVVIHLAGRLMMARNGHVAHVVLEIFQPRRLIQGVPVKSVGTRRRGVDVLPLRNGSPLHIVA